MKARLLAAAGVATVLLAAGAWWLLDRAPYLAPLSDYKMLLFSVNQHP